MPETHTVSSSRTPARMRETQPGIKLAKERASTMTRSSQLWIAQCNAAKRIEDNFGIDKDLTYVIGEKLQNLLDSRGRMASRGRGEEKMIARSRTSPVWRTYSAVRNRRRAASVNCPLLIAAYF